MQQEARLDTLAIHAGQEPDPGHLAVMPPLVLASTFGQPSPGRPLRYEYSRSGNPTREALERCLAALEGGRRGLAFGSGTAASLAVLHLLRPGDHVVAGDDLYGGSFRLLDKVMKPLGVDSSFVDLRDLARAEAAFTERTRLLWLETPTNPLLKVFDIAELSRLASARGVLVVVDNTFASPVLQRPLALGADIVLHSTTKYINGHSDVVGGALVVRDEALGERLAFLQNALGGVPSPFDCYLVLRGIKTLGVRMRHHCRSATVLAERLERDPRVRAVHYPGLPSHPDHALAGRQMLGPGGMISLELVGDLERARSFLSALRVFTLAESLGGVESLAESPALMTHASIPSAQRAASGLSDTLVRLSVGLEDVEDLWEDLDAALGARAGG